MSLEAPCGSCEEAGRAPFLVAIPRPWQRLAEALQGASGGSIYSCSGCGSLWEALYTREEIYHQTSLPRSFLSLLRKDPPFEEAWVLSGDPAARPWLTNFLQRGSFDAGRAVATLADAFESARDRQSAAELAEHLAALFENPRCDDADLDGYALTRRLASHPLLTAGAERERMLASLSRRLSGRRRREPASPRPAAPPKPVFAEVLSESGALVLGKSGSFLPAIALTAGFCELARAGQPQNFLFIAWGMLPMLAGLYLSAAAHARGRWPALGPVKLALQRAPAMLDVYPLYAAAFGVFLLAALALNVLIPDGRDLGTARGFWLASLGAVFWRRWPLLALPWVYDGYPEHSNFKYQGYTWHSPGSDVSVSICRQEGFARKVAAPLYLFAAAVVVAHSLIGTASPFAARAFLYAAAAPLLAALLDGLVEGWRVKSGDFRFDR